MNNLPTILLGMPLCVVSSSGYINRVSVRISWIWIKRVRARARLLTHTQQFMDSEKTTDHHHHRTKLNPLRLINILAERKSNEEERSKKKKRRVPFDLVSSLSGEQNEHDSLIPNHHTFICQFATDWIPVQSLSPSAPLSPLTLSLDCAL